MAPEIKERAYTQIDEFFHEQASFMPNINGGQWAAHGDVTHISAGAMVTVLDIMPADQNQSGRDLAFIAAMSPRGFDAFYTWMDLDRLTAA